MQCGDTLGNLERVMSGELWIAEVFNGDVFYKAKDRQDIKFFNPKEGFVMSMDVLVISADSVRKEEAYELINFLMEPRIAARTSNEFFYAPCVDADVFLDKAILSSPVLFPSVELMQKGELLKDIGATEAAYLEVFSSLKQKNE